MSFVVKNISVGSVSLDDFGLTLAAGEEFELSEESANDVAKSTDLPDAISAGNLVVLDPLDDLTQLSIADSLLAVDQANNPNYRIFGGELDQLDDVNISNPVVDEVLVAIAGSPTGSPVPIKWINQPAGAASDQLVRVSGTDTTSGFLADKLVIGSPATISLTVKNPAGNETLAIDLDAELDDLNDVSVPSPTEGQVLTFTGSPIQWVAADPGAAGSPIQDLFDTIIGDTGSQTASTPNDTLAILGSTGITTAVALVGSPQVVTLTIENVAPKFVTVSGDSGVATADNVADDLKLIGGFKITTTASEAIGSPEQDGVLIDWGAALSDLSDVTAGNPVGSPTPINNNTLKFTTTGSPPLNQWINVSGVAAAPSGSFGVIQLFWGPISGVSGTTKISKDDTTPLISEGTEIWSQSITPTVGSPATTVRARTNFTFSSSNSALEIVIAVFRDSTCIGVGVSSTSNNNSGFSVSTSFYDPNATPGFEHTYSCRVGRTGNNGTWYINQISGFTDAFPGGSPVVGLLTEQNAFLVEEIGENG